MSHRPFGEDSFEAESRRHTPSIGVMPEAMNVETESAPPSEAANEDFLFHLYRGSELLQDNRVHEAKEELERALHLQPRDAKGQDLLAVVYFRLGLYPRAISIYERLRKKNPHDPALLLNLALCFLKTGQPSLARRDLEQLLSMNGAHTRAWGYLGLACERLGDLPAAQRAFERGGHIQMAKRIAIRRASSDAPAEPPKLPSEPTREVREVVAAAYQELDSGELSFALAEPTNEGKKSDLAGESWRPVELGRQDARSDETRGGAPPAVSPAKAERHPASASLPHPGPAPAERRPTLIAPIGAPPAHGVSADYPIIDKIPSQKPPAFTLDDAGTPSLRRPVVAVPPAFNVASRRTATREMEAVVASARRTLPPPEAFHPESDKPAAPAPVNTITSAGNAPRVMPPAPLASSLPPPSAAALTRDSIVRFPKSAGVVLHPSGVALARTTTEIGFSTRLEAIRAQSAGLGLKLLERQVKGKPTGESFGGVASPVAHVSGDGELVLAARTGRRLSSFTLADEACFAREEVLLGWGGTLAYENGRLATGEGEFVPVVQLKGQGAVLLEAIGDILTLAVSQGHGLSVRREVILGWFGRLVPRALAPSEAPCGQRGLVSFAGEGRILVASV